MNTCRINDETCTAYRLTAFQTDYCLNHQGIERDHPHEKGALGRKTCHICDAS